MEALLVKTELNCNGRRPLAVPAAPSDVVRCVKRRRREPNSPAVGTNASGEPLGHSTTANGTTVKRSSRFRGVSRHRWTGRFEAHLWDKGSWNATQRKKGKQVYLGAYDEEESAARAYDLAALKYWGPTTFTNFPVSDYENEIQIMQNVTKEEYLASLRRKSSGFSRGVSKYRGVARHHHNGRWEARIGRVFGNKYLYLGTYSTQEEAAHAYDIAAIEYRGINAVTNFDLSTYIRWLRPGAANALASSPQENHVNREAQATLPCFNPFIATDIDSIVSNPFLDKGSCVKSSPTALSLLLRSSMFRQLMEKNSNAPNEETYEESAKISQRQPVEAADEFNGIFCAGIPNVPYLCSSNVDKQSHIELQENACTAQSLWNGVLGLPTL